MKFFGEKPTSATTEDFFGIFAAFIMNFTVSDSIMYRSVFEQYCMKLLQSAFRLSVEKVEPYHNSQSEERRIYLEEPIRTQSKNCKAL